MKWFTAKNLTELKAQYKQLIKKYHPDLTGGTTEKEMAEINAEFDKLHDTLPEVNAKGETYQPRADARGMAAAFRAAILAALRCEGVLVELCGSWLWATGNTKAHKDELKAAGYKWSQNKGAWYWHTHGYIKRSRHDWTLDDIRSRFGSQQFAADNDNDSDREKIPA